MSITTLPPCLLWCCSVSSPTSATVTSCAPGGRVCVQWRDLSMEEGLLRTIKNDVEEGVELDMNTLLTYNGRGLWGGAVLGQG